MFLFTNRQFCFPSPFIDFYFRSIDVRGKSKK
jgi:hypothetical protein